MMHRPVKTVLCAALLAVSFAAAGCRYPIPHSHPAQAISSYGAVPASGSVPSSAAEWRSALKDANLTLGSDGAAIIIMAPKNAQKTLAKVSAWLQASRPYTDDVPQSTFNGIFMANIGPASLSIDTARKQTLTLQPAWYIVPSDKPVGGYETYETRYVTNVLQLKKDDQTSYLTCKPLYDWLKNDTWKTEFKPWQR